MSEDMIDDCIKFGDCAEVLSHLFQYVDDELEDDPRIRYQTHLERCHYCRNIADVEKHLRGLMRSACAEQAPSSLRTRIEQDLIAYRSQGQDVFVTTTTVEQTFE